MAESSSRWTSASTLRNTSDNDETAPLLNKSKSVTRFEDHVAGTEGDVAEEYGSDEGSEGKGREVDVYTPGKSSFTQTVMNVLGDLLGQGILACPLAFAYSGWVLGPILLMLAGALTLYTLKCIIRIIEKDRRLRNFTEIIGYSLGTKAERAVSLLFLAEILVWIVALAVVFSDSTNVIFPSVSTTQWKLYSLIILLPLSFLPLRYLSFVSAVGVISTWTLVGVLVWVGITTKHYPGALREPAHTDVLPVFGAIKLGKTIGLFISGYGGHGFIPNLIRDMRKPQRADRAVEISYGIVLLVYILVAVCGYLMYGSNVHDQVSKDLAMTAGFTPFLNRLAIWSTALNALFKIPLGYPPMSDTVMSQLGLHPTVLIPATAPTPRYVTRPNSPDSRQSVDSVGTGAISDDLDILDSELREHERKERSKSIGRFLVKLLMPTVPVLLAIVLPSFESLLSFLGSGCAIALAIILPISAKAGVFGWKRYDAVICVVSAILAVVGTICAFWPS